MAIYGLDISLYQEYPWKKIDWVALKNDPKNFRFIWIKCQEGSFGPYDQGAYDLELVKAQVAGALSVKFEAVNLYHYYWYQYMVASTGQWLVISAYDQAKAFYDTWVASGLSVEKTHYDPVLNMYFALHPMTDIEDPLIGQFLTWSDTAGINKAIGFARKLNAHIRDYHQFITDLFGVRPDIYTGKWWLDKFVPLLINNGYASEVAWMKLYKFILADYDGTLNIPDYIGESQVISWQETSSPVPDVKGIPTGRVRPGDALDIDKWMRTDIEFDEWCGKKETVPTMAGTYKTNILTKDRGHFVWLSGDDKNIDMAGVSLGTDAIFLRMCSQATRNMTVSKDAAFPIWTDRATKPVVGVVEMDQNLFWNKEIPLPVFQDSAKRNMWNNETLRAILEQWHIAQIPQAEWDAKKLNITAKEGWHNIGALVLFMSTTSAKGSLIGGLWQQAIVDDLLKPLTTLMEGGYIPTVKIYLMASWDWYRTYATDAGWTPASRLGNKQLAGLGLTRVWGQPATGLMTEIPMGTPYASVGEFWQNIPSDSYVYPLSLDGIDFQFFVFSFNRLMATGAFYPGATVTPITSGMWCDVAANMGLGANVVVPPVEPPVEPPVDPLLEARVKALEDEDVLMKETLDRIEAYLKTIPKY